MKATESVQITLHLLKYVLYGGVTFPNDSCFMTKVASAPKYFIDASCYKYVAAMDWILG